MSFGSGFAKLAGGFFGSLGKMFPGILQGQRQAIQDNWSDLLSYNNVKLGQINNLWNEATFPLDWMRAYDNTQLSEWSTDLAGENYALQKALLFPKAVQVGAENIYAPYLEQLRRLAALRQGAGLLGAGGITKMPSIG